MASCLAKKGYPLIVYDADSSPAEKFVKEFSQCKVANHVGSGHDVAPDAFRGCGILITMLPNGSVVKDVLLGEKGIAVGLKTGEESNP